MKLSIRGSMKPIIRHVRKAQRARANEVSVGFHSTAKYPPVRTGQRGGGKQSVEQVAQVAAWQEYGTDTIPERPYFRQAASRAKPAVVALVAAESDPAIRVFSTMLAGRIGVLVQAEVQRSITRLKDPPNAPATIARKGSTNPLIDTATLKNSVTYRVS